MFRPSLDSTLRLAEKNGPVHGQAALASAALFPPDAKAMRAHVYKRILDAYPSKDRSQSRAVVESVLSGTAITLRHQYANPHEASGINLADPNEYAASVNEVCLLAQYLTDQLHFQLTVVPADPALHGAWRYGIL